MWFKLIIIILISLTLITYGALWYRKSTPPDSNYDFNEDLKRFLTPRLDSSSLFNFNEPQRIVPTLMTLGGLFIFFIGLSKSL